MIRPRVVVLSRSNPERGLGRSGQWAQAAAMGLPPDLERAGDHQHAVSFSRPLID
ncbi:MAG TPA: hypothetical protein VFJ82_17100 [Longimicrobium sp.]|nr:hypothetical protein [Longimicrobium sp.]